VAAGVLAADVAPLPRRAPATMTATDGDPLAVPPVADTYVVRQMDWLNKGSAEKLTASHWSDWHTEAYVSFVVPPGVKNLRSARLRFTFNRLDHQPATVELRSLPTTGWSEKDTTWANRPKAGEVLATAEITAQGTRELSFDVSSWVNGPGTYAFALTNPNYWSAASLYSREAGARGPRLILTPAKENGGRPSPTVPAAPSPTPTATATPKPTPTASATSQPSPDTSAQPRPPAQPSQPPVKPADAPLCGASFNTLPGETFQQALARVDKYYGGLQMVRIFYAGLPSKWPGKMDVGKRPIVVSFKMNPRDVLSGKHDGYMREWFATAPKDQDIYWVYYHEPEDNIRSGEFTAPDYRAAWKRLRSLADQAGNPRLRATLVLMSWTLDARSGRNWRDYYPGRDVIQVLGWDVYNLLDKKGLYEPPKQMYQKVIEVSEQEKLPFGIAETGSYLVGGDTGEKRAKWLREMVAHLGKAGALWVAYFDLDWPSGDFRLLDAPSRKAWQDFCRD